LDVLKEKEEQKKREAEEKRQRAEERLLKRRQKEEELKQKREERARKAEERALKAKEKAEERAFKEKEKAEQRALKAKEGKSCKVQNDAAQGCATKRQQVAGRCGSVSGVVRQTRPLRKRPSLMMMKASIQTFAVFVLVHTKMMMALEEIGCNVVVAGGFMKIVWTQTLRILRSCVLCAKISL